MKTRNRIVSLILAAAMLTAVLAGCGGTEPETTTTAATTAGTTAAPTERTDTLATGSQTVIMTRSTTSGSESAPETPASTEPTGTAEPTDTTPSEASTEDSPAVSIGPGTLPSTEDTTAPSGGTETTALLAAARTGTVRDVSGVLTVGSWAMEYYYASDSGLQSYANQISAVKSYLPNVNVYAMFIPVAIAFYCPEGHSGGSDQRAVMERWYDMMPTVVGVNTYGEMAGHADEYMYFRTDTHWTQRGGYYAYRAFCKAAGFTPNDIGAYDYAADTGYLGYMYAILKNSSVGSLMSANPDTVEKFKPLSDLTATVYQSPAMSGGYGVSVVNMDSTNYYAFTGGDQPLICIENASVSNGRVGIVTKDSYGNALVPFLCDHFETLYVIDQRYFNTDSTYSMNIVSFAQSHGVTDIIVEANAFNASASASTFGKMVP